MINKKIKFLLKKSDVTFFGHILFELAQEAVIPFLKNIVNN
jgi:hypothetical protein